MEAHMHSMLGKQEKGKNIINIYMCTLSHRLYNIVSIIYKHMCTVPYLKSIYSKQQKLVKYKVTIFTDVTVDNDIKVIT